MKEVPQRTLLILVVVLIVISVFSTWLFLSSVQVVPKAAPSSSSGIVNVYVLPKPSSSEGTVNVEVLPK